MMLVYAFFIKFDKIPFSIVVDKNNFSRFITITRRKLMLKCNAISYFMMAFSFNIRDRIIFAV
jgi:hypothetical protein